ncbi:MAG: hypothetical protein Q9200_000018 [Gallowayella weberi]
MSTANQQPRILIHKTAAVRLGLELLMLAILTELKALRDSLGLPFERNTPNDELIRTLEAAIVNEGYAEQPLVIIVRYEGQTQFNWCCFVTFCRGVGLSLTDKALQTFNLAELRGMTKDNQGEWTRVEAQKYYHVFTAAQCLNFKSDDLAIPAAMLLQHAYRHRYYVRHKDLISRMVWTMDPMVHALSCLEDQKSAQQHQAEYQEFIRRRQLLQHQVGDLTGGWNT